MKKKSMGNSLLLLLTAFIWGVAFVAQSVGMDYIGPFSFNGARFLMGSLVLLPLIYVRRKSSLKSGISGKADDWQRYKDKEKNIPRTDFKVTLTGGVCCGLALCSAALCQQIGIMYTTVGKAGFITTLYIVIVPIIGVFLGKKAGKKIWTGAGLAAVGMYLLCMSERLTLGRGDTYVFICAVLFSIHILVIDYFSPKVDGVELSCIQFLTAGVISSVLALVFEKPELQNFIDGIIPLAYAGIMSCGVAYTLQVVGQKNMDPTVASLILSMESVFSVLAGWVILGQALSIRELFGCMMVFGAVILVQLPDRKSSKI